MHPVVAQLLPNRLNDLKQKKNPNIDVIEVADLPCEPPSPQKTPKTIKPNLDITAHPKSSQFQPLVNPA